MSRLRVHTSLGPNPTPVITPKGCNPAAQPRRTPATPGLAIHPVHPMSHPLFKVVLTPNSRPRASPTLTA